MGQNVPSTQDGEVGEFRVRKQQLEQNIYGGDSEFRLKKQGEARAKDLRQQAKKFMTNG